MLKFLNEIREKNKDDEKVLKAINEIEKEINNKKYGLVWEEHEEEVDRMLKDNIPVFCEQKDKEIKESDDGYNFLLEGDNLHSLKLLEKTHKGKIDVIYIDPPYNTGNKDFMYSDDYVGSDDSYRHSKWLSFISERMYFAKKLMSESAFIFISIDEKEFAQLKILCDEIFGEDNYVNEIVWQKLSASKAQSSYFSNLHEKVLVYRKSNKAIMNKLYLPVDSNDKSYPYIEKKTGRKWGSFDFTQKGDGEGKWFGETYLEPPKGKHWIWSQERIDEGLKKDLIVFTKNGTPRVKRYLDEKKGNLIGDIWIENGIAPLSANDKERVGFETQKPVSLIKRVLETEKKSATVLDFFAGSGTTAQAVLELNKEDGGNRKFILCTNNENNICEDITYQRVKTVITGKRKDGSEYSEGIPANLKYYKTDFVSKDEEYLEEELNDHIREMIQLEHGIDVDDSGYCLILSDEDADELENNIDDLEDVKGIYISSDVLLTTSQKSKFKDLEKYIIPECFYDKEINNK